MFSNKIFKSNITQGAYTNLKEAIPHDKEELKKLFEDTIRGQIKTSVARALIFEQFWAYVDLEKEIKNNIIWERRSIELSTLPFVDDIFISDYIRGLNTYKENYPFWVSVSKDYPEVKAFKTEDDFESNSKRLIIDFQDEVYDRLVDEANKSKGEKYFEYWEVIDCSFGFIFSYVEMLAEIDALLNDDFTHTLKRLSTVRKAEQPNKAPAPTSPQEIDPTNKPWQENYEAVIGVYKLFPKHLPILKEQGYVIINDKRKSFTWNLHKASKADLARYFAAIKPKNSRVALWQEIITLFDLKIEPQTMAGHASKAKYSETFDGIYKLLHLDEIKTQKP